MRKHETKKQQRTAPSDPGVDTATVKTQTALFVDPSIDAAKISVLYPGDRTVLVSRDTWNGWLRVIQISSGHQGWVRSNRLVIYYTNHRKPDVAIDAVSLGTSDPPIIEVINDTDTNLYLHIDKLAEMSISPHATRSVTVQAGIFAFNASEPKRLPSFGSMAFLNGSKYTWRFFVGSVLEHNRQNVVTPTEVAEYRRLLADVETKTAESKIGKQQLDDDRAALHKQRDEVEGEVGDIDAKRPLLDHSDDKAVDDFNRLVESANNDAHAFKKMQEQFNAEVAAFNSHLDTLNAEQRQLVEREKAINAAR